MSPVRFKTRLSTPAAGAGTATVAFSLSTSTSGSSTWTRSPSFLSQAPMVACVTDSPSDGTFSWIDMSSALLGGRTLGADPRDGLSEGLAHELLLLEPVARRRPRGRARRRRARDERDARRELRREVGILNLYPSSYPIGFPATIAVHFDPRLASYVSAGYDTPEFRKLWDDAKVQHDDDAMKQIIWQLQDMMSDQCLGLMIARSVDIWGVSKRVHGLTPMYFGMSSTSTTGKWTVTVSTPARQRK